MLDPHRSAADDPGSTWLRQNRPKLEYQVGPVECAKRSAPGPLAAQLRVRLALCSLPVEFLNEEFCRFL